MHCGKSGLVPPGLGFSTLVTALRVRRFSRVGLKARPTEFCVGLRPKIQSQEGLVKIVVRTPR